MIDYHKYFTKKLSKNKSLESSFHIWDYVNNGAGNCGRVGLLLHVSTPQELNYSNNVKYKMTGGQRYIAVEAYLWNIELIVQLIDNRFY